MMGFDDAARADEIELELDELKRAHERRGVLLRGALEALGEVEEVVGEKRRPGFSWEGSIMEEEARGFERTLMGEAKGERRAVNRAVEVLACFKQNFPRVDLARAVEEGRKRVTIERKKAELQRAQAALQAEMDRL
jgi:hypothetical protein